jgi:hypothetical protein
MAEFTFWTAQEHDEKIVSRIIEKRDQAALTKLESLTARIVQEASASENDTADHVTHELTGFYDHDSYLNNSVLPRKFIAHMLYRLAIRYARRYELGELGPDDLTIDSDLKLESNMVSLFILKSGQRHRVVHGDSILGKGEGAKAAWEAVVLGWADMYAAELLKGM